VKKVKNPKVSVIIPVYNVEPWLRECLDSVLAQPHKNLEIILINDGSADNSGGICDEYARKHPNVMVIHQPNQGPSAARDAGLDAAKGEYIYFLDSDDYIAPDALQILVDEAVKSQTDIVSFGSTIVDEDGNIALGAQLRERRGGEYPGVSSGLELFELLHVNDELFFAVWAAFFRRGFLEENGLRFGQVRSSEDILFSFQAFALAKRAVCLPRDLHFYRVRGNSLMTKIVSSNGVVDYAFVFTELIDFCARRGLFEKSDAVAERIISLSSNALAVYFIIGDAEKRLCETALAAFVKAVDDNREYLVPRHVPVKVSGKIIAYGVLGLRGKKYIEFLYGTPYEPDELWDMAGDGERVKKPDFERLTKDDLVIVFPKGLTLETPCPTLGFNEMLEYIFPVILEETRKLFDGHTGGAGE
jgi:glycosyltransferase involved in cell wall biosynthesis